MLDSLEPRLLMSADVLTYHNDNLRTGANLSETVLTPANVNATDFGKIGQVAVDGVVYAQPLYKSNVAIPGQGTHNVVLVATENDSVYAFDADSGALLWHDSFINPAAGVTAVPFADVGTNNIAPVIGITSTPVIDPATNTIYVVDKIKIAQGNVATYSQQLHALDVATGAEKFGGPVTIEASALGTALVTRQVRVGRRTQVRQFKERDRTYFSALYELQRSALLLENGVVYIAFASHGDLGPYHGWVLGYSARTLRQVSAFDDTPSGTAGGIWMSGGGPAADAQGNIYAASGNGTFDANQRGGTNYGDSVFKLEPRAGLAVRDSFTPSNQAKLNANDLDFGSGGVLLLPDQPGRFPHELVTAGKTGTLYLINRDSMGGFNATADRVIETIPNPNEGLFATPAYFNGTIYYVGVGINAAAPPQVLKAYHLVNGLLVPIPVQGQIPYAYPGSTPSISANGTTNGIVWTLDTSGWFNNTGAILRAYDANNIANELYDSAQAPNQRDQAGGAVRFTVPTVANGKVYVGGVNSLTIYGLLPPA